MQETTENTLAEIGQSLLTQDNRITAQPAFCVQVLERHGPMLPEYSDRISFFDHEMCEVIYEDGPDPDEWKRLKGLHDDFELPDRYTAGGYIEAWKTVQTCFTEDGCKRYLELDGHNLRHYHGTRIYAESFGRNEEMVKVRDFLLSQAK